MNISIYVYIYTQWPSKFFVFCFFLNTKEYLFNYLKSQNNTFNLLYLKYREIGTFYTGLPIAGPL